MFADIVDCSTSRSQNDPICTVFQFEGTAIWLCQMLERTVIDVRVWSDWRYCLQSEWWPITSIFCISRHNWTVCFQNQGSHRSASWTAILSRFSSEPCTATALGKCLVRASKKARARNWTRYFAKVSPMLSVSFVVWRRFFQCHHARHAGSQLHGRDCSAFVFLQRRYCRGAEVAADVWWWLHHASI